MTTVQRLGLSDGDLGTAQTIDAMRRCILESLALPIVRESAVSIVHDTDPTDKMSQVYAVRDWLAAHIHFLRDPAGVELLHTPEWQLREIFAHGAARVDCDDAAILAGALMGSIGWNVTLVTAAFGERDAPYAHVWCSVSLDGADWTELDVTRPMQDLPLDRISRWKDWPVC